MGKILLRDQKFFVLNGGTATEHFLLGRGPFQCDPISAFLFIPTLENWQYFTNTIFALFQ